MGLTGARKSPWQNPFAERVIGSIRRECTNHIIPLGERHLIRALRRYATYYNESRTHLSLDRNSPLPRGVENGPGEIIAIPCTGRAILGELSAHHNTRRCRELQSAPGRRFS